MDKEKKKLTRDQLYGYPYESPEKIKRIHELPYLFDKVNWLPDYSYECEYKMNDIGEINKHWERCVQLHDKEAYIKWEEEDSAANSCLFTIVKLFLFIGAWKFIEALFL